MSYSTVFTELYVMPFCIKSAVLVNSPHLDTLTLTVEWLADCRVSGVSCTTDVVHYQCCEGAGSLDTPERQQGTLDFNGIHYKGDVQSFSVQKREKDDGYARFDVSLLGFAIEFL